MADDMERLGVDLNDQGSVMSKLQLEDSRRRKGECLTCGRKCFRKKIFRMEPITDHGRVLNGRCLNCRPLEVATAQTVLPAVSRPVTEQDRQRFNLASGRTESHRPAPISDDSRPRTIGAFDRSGRGSGSRGSNPDLGPRRNGAKSRSIGTERDLNRPSAVGGPANNMRGNIVAVAAAQQLQQAYLVRHPRQEEKRAEEVPPTPASAASSSSNIGQGQRHPTSLSDGHLGGQSQTRFAEEVNHWDSD